MIESLIKNELTKKRYRVFKKRKLAVFSFWPILIMTLLSLSAEFWSNSKPLVISYQNKIYFPVLKDYHPQNFGVSDSLYMNYRTLTLGKEDWALWPPFQWDPYESNDSIQNYPGPPSKANLMGTDDRGRDVLARLLYGFRYGLGYSVLVWLLCFGVGTALGAMMGYYGGKVDFFGQRVVEVLSTVPQFFLLIIVIAIFQPNLLLLVLISSLFGWISISYYVRAEFLRNRKLEYVESARALGRGNFGIIFKHILPNSLGPIITFTPFVIAGNIVSLASLDYLGFGLTPPTPSWGELLNQAQKNFTIAWWLAVYPSLCLFLTLTMLALIGEGVRDAMDPKHS